MSKGILASAGSSQPIRITGAGPATIRAAEGEGKDAKLASFEGTAYTGAVMRPGGWFEDLIIDLGGVEVPSQHRPALRQHDHEQIVGHTTEVKVNKEGVHVAGLFSGQQEHSDKVVVPAKNGFQWQLSIGADPITTERLEPGEEADVNGRTVKGPLVISRKTRLGEISFVPLGADGDTSATIAAQQGGPKMNPWHLALKDLMTKLRAAAGTVELAKYSDGEIDKMTADEARAALKKCMDEEGKAKAADDDDDDDDDGEDGKKAKNKSKSARALRIQAEVDQVMTAARQQAATEHIRQSAITAAVRKHLGADPAGHEIELDGKRVILIAHAIGQNWTVERAELEALRAARPTGPVGVPGGLAYATTTPEVTGAVLESAVLHALRHQLLLEDDSFYLDMAPDGRTPIRRVPARIQAEAQRDFRQRYTDQVQQAAHTRFHGRITLHELLSIGLRLTGYTGSLDLRSEGGITSALKAWDYLDRQNSIRAEGSSNASFSNILANVMNKFALQGYLYTEQTWREICAIRPVSDFKATKSINLLGLTQFKKFGAAGELVNFTLGDQAFSNQADPYGGIVTIPWTHLVNDDLGILGQVPAKVGQGAGLALNDVIWALWAAMAAGTVNGDDGVAFFRTGSLLTDAAKKQGKAYKANKMSGGPSALSSAALATAKALYDNQIDPNGNPLGFEGTMPTLLFGPSNWVTALELATYRELVYGGAAAAKQPQGNIWAGKVKPAMSRYIENASYVNSTTAFWLMFNPAVLAVIEACFLNGVDTPAVLQAGPDYQFDKPGISIRGTMPFGANQQNFRGGVYSVGA